MPVCKKDRQDGQDDRSEENKYRHKRPDDRPHDTKDKQDGSDDRQ